MKENKFGSIKTVAGVITGIAIAAGALITGLSSKKHDPDEDYDEVDVTEEETETTEEEETEEAES